MSKTIALAFVAALSAGAASADSYLPFTAAHQDRDSVIELDTVRADSNGVVEIYSYHAGEIGDLLGTEAVSDGANANVRVGLGHTPVTDVIALLKVDGQVVDTQEIELR